jgi:tellurite resistance protein TehA-like permease
MRRGQPDHPPAGRQPPSLLDRVLNPIGPEAGADVMGTGIVSVALSLDGDETISRILLAMAAVTWALLLGPVLGHWKTPTIGASLVLTVATESLAALAAIVAVSDRAEWLLVIALAPFALGLCFYLFVISRFDLRQLAVGYGDHWITGGALAISTLAAGKLLDGARALAILGDGGGVLKGVALVLWVLTMLWLPVLLFAEVHHPRLAYDLRWSTVFPFGIYAACSFVLGAAAHAGAITSFARVWVWIALALWAVVLVGMIRRAIRAVPVIPRGAAGAS